MTEFDKTGLDGIYSLAELAEMQFDELKQPVEGLITEGVTLLAGAPKIGKSWLMLDLCLSVAEGTPFLGRRTQKGSVLYLDLEGSPKLLRQRMHQLGRDIPKGVGVTHKALPIGGGLEKELYAWTQSVKDPALIVIDTLQRVRGIPAAGMSVYETDYRIYGGLKKLAAATHTAIVLVHHLNKMTATDDPFDRISGSSGLFGAADAAVLVSRPRGEDMAEVMVQSRVIFAGDFRIRFRDGQWEAVDAEAEARKEFLTSPVRRAVLKLAEAQGERVRDIPRAVLEDACIEADGGTRSFDLRAELNRSFLENLMKIDRLCMICKSSPARVRITRLPDVKPPVSPL